MIDRAVRFYRKNFWTFVWIAAPPIITGTIISVGWTILGRNLFTVDMVNNPTETSLYYVFLWFGALIIWFVEGVATLTVMGGASRNFVRHLLFGEPITFRETYRNVKSRILGLIVASSIITVLLGVIGYILFLIGFLIAIVVVAITAAAFSFSPFLIFMISLTLTLLIAFGTGWLFFLIASHFLYIPQAMLVENLSVPKAMGRSASLARGNVKRLYALFVFSTIAIYSGLMLLKVPLDLYAWANGVELWSFENAIIPAWYEISSQFIWQASLILLMPVWMIGLCLLYVDERVRHEGYDIELLAAGRLGEIPAIPREFPNPLEQFVPKPLFLDPPSNQPPSKRSPYSPLGLN